MQVEEVLESYKRYLKNPEFIKWGIVISRIVWNKTNRDITDSFEIKTPYIYQVLERFKTVQDFDDQTKGNGGTNKKLIGNSLELIELITKENRCLSAYNVSNLIEEEHDIEIGVSTVNRGRNQVGLYYSNINNKSQLSKINIKSCLEYCTTYKKDSFEDVLFTDESTFQLHSYKQKQWMTDYENNTGLQKIPNPNYKIMIWSGICTRRKTTLKIIRLEKQEKIDSGSYIQILKEHCIPIMNQLYGKQQWRLVQDYARPHVSKETKDFLNEAKIQSIQHPAQSLDLNPIEKIWSLMKKEVGKVTYTNIFDFIDAVQLSWDNISEDLIINIIEHHLKIIKEIKKNKGNLVE